MATLLILYCFAGGARQVGGQNESRMSCIGQPLYDP